MIVVSVRLPKYILDKIDEYVVEGIYANRSEAFRDALRILIEKIELFKREGKKVARDANGRLVVL